MVNRDPVVSADHDVLAIECHAFGFVTHGRERRSRAGRLAGVKRVQLTRGMSADAVNATVGNKQISAFHIYPKIEYLSVAGPHAADLRAVSRNPYVLAVRTNCPWGSANLSHCA